MGRPPPPATSLAREIDLFGATTLVMVGIVGSAIFVAVISFLTKKSSASKSG